MSTFALMLVAVSVKGYEFRKYEVYEFIESFCSVEIKDVSLLPTEPSTAIVQFASPITDFKNETFKGHRVSFTIFPDELAFSKFIRTRLEPKQRRTQVPFLIVVDFHGTEEDLRAVFSRASGITRESFSHYNYFKVSFSSRSVAEDSYEYYPDSDFKVSIVYPDDVERAFAVDNCSNIKSLSDITSKYGELSSGLNGLIYVLCNSISDSEKLCPLVNCTVIDGKRLTAFFVDSYQYNRQKPHLH